jgi:hypothetical protein
MRRANFKEPPPEMVGALLLQKYPEISQSEVILTDITENEIGTEVLQILSVQKGGEAMIEFLKAELPKRVPSSVQSPGAWGEQLQNIKTHDRAPGNIFRDGYAIIATSGGWRITPNGFRRLKAAV